MTNMRNLEIEADATITRDDRTLIIQRLLPDEPQSWINLSTLPSGDSIDYAITHLERRREDSPDTQYRLVELRTITTLQVFDD